MMPRAPLRAIALTAALSMASCSWVVMRTAPDPPVRTEPNCSTTRIPAFVDFYFGVPVLLVGVLLVALTATETGEDDDIAQAAGYMFIGSGGLFTWSGISGLRLARECRDAEAEYEEWVNNRSPEPVKRNPWEKRPVPPGSEGGMCARGNACSPGLTCASGFCVRLAPAPAPDPTPTPPPGGGPAAPPPPY